MMTREDRRFLSGLAEKLANVERIRIKGVTIDDSQYILIDDVHAKILSSTLQDIVKRDSEKERLVDFSESIENSRRFLLN